MSWNLCNNCHPTFLTSCAKPAWRCYIIDDDLHGADGVKLGDVNKDGWLDIVTGWEESGETRIYLFPGTSHGMKIRQNKGRGRGLY
ncbi:hypothetical protein EH223_14875 [candidate division KSB1 bacterium]|nr:FG-GAP repeat protein [candidate division KSB1 bacterium]RQW01449.1 MAG: hypothetical protein EH223_14875 [candidate division KSB1 bacterium]